MIPMKSHRQARINEVIREVASETILFEIKDPRVKMVTVTRAEVSGDLQHGKVFVSIMGTEQEQARSLKALNHAAGFVQSKLADRMKTRFLPVLRFVIDEGIKNSLEVSRLLAEARALDAAHKTATTGEDGTDAPEGDEPSAEEELSPPAAQSHG
jgi:ribosome-binding factor A